jgi:hypothetical protein
MKTGTRGGASVLSTSRVLGIQDECLKHFDKTNLCANSLHANKLETCSINCYQLQDKVTGKKLCRNCQGTGKYDSPPTTTCDPKQDTQEFFDSRKYVLSCMCATLCTCDDPSDPRNIIYATPEGVPKATKFKALITKAKDAAKKLVQKGKNFLNVIKGKGKKLLKGIKGKAKKAMNKLKSVIKIFGKKSKQAKKARKQVIKAKAAVKQVKQKLLNKRK